MAKLFKNSKNNTDYFVIDLEELTMYNELPLSLCGGCLKVLNDKENLILIPILNEVYCEKCGYHRIEGMYDYIEDRPIQAQRTNFYKEFFKSINRMEE